MKLTMPILVQILGWCCLTAYVVLGYIYLVGKPYSLTVCLELPWWVWGLLVAGGAGMFGGSYWAARQSPVKRIWTRDLPK